MADSFHCCQALARALFCHRAAALAALAWPCCQLACLSFQVVKALRSMLPPQELTAAAILSDLACAEATLSCSTCNCIGDFVQGFVGLRNRNYIETVSDLNQVSLKFAKE